MAHWKPTFVITRECIMPSSSPLVRCCWLLLVALAGCADDGVQEDRSISFGHDGATAFQQQLMAAVRV